MSTASVTEVPQIAPGHGAAPVRHWLRFFRSELRNVFLRPRNLAMLAVLAGAPVFLGVVLWINTPAPGSGGPGAGVFVGQIAENGVFLSLFAIYVLLTVLLPLAVSVVSGDSVAGEAGLGTLRTLLTVPAGRARLLATKYATIVVFCFAATLIVAGLGLLMGAIFFPVGPVTLLSGDTVPLADGLARLALIVCYVAAALSALGAIGIALSTFTQHAIAVMATMLVVVIVSEILDAVSQVAAIHPYLPSHFWFSFDALLRTPIAWSGVLHGLASFAAYAVIFGAVAWARMRRANITC
ncbi:MAG TPA: ABC transporter permease subunit [Streptosporangiaceae bacterium]|nr:ABC transporter permease subunit [Streptosporangiaceae bacterium]